MLRKILRYLPAVISGGSILCATVFGSIATRMLNDTLQEMDGGALPTLTIAALACYRYYLIPSLAIFSLCIIGWLEWKVQEQSRRLAVELYILSLFLLLTALIFVAMALPFTCFCKTL